MPPSQHSPASRGFSFTAWVSFRSFPAAGGAHLLHLTDGGELVLHERESANEEFLPTKALMSEQCGARADARAIVAVA